MMDRDEMNIGEVVAGQLCTGCGVRSYLAPERYEMVDDLNLGRRPMLIRSSDSHGDLEDDDAIRSCPGRQLKHSEDPRGYGAENDLSLAWGPVIEIWEGHASDPEIRLEGSSGGVLTALSLYCIEREGMHGVLHSTSKVETPYLNESVMSTDRSQLLAATGSRYAPTSPCDSLDLIEKAPSPCVFVGKPCDVAGLRGAQESRPALNDKLGLALSFFCAGTPSTRGTLELLKRAGVSNLAGVESVRYRGNGWPGRWIVRARGDDGDIHQHSMTYDDSWDFLQRFRQWRCYICPDHTGEFADISCGDAWHRDSSFDAGRSLVVVRTEVGRDILHRAMAAGYLSLRVTEPRSLYQSQPNLLDSRCSLWGRLLALRLSGAPAPSYSGFPLAKLWLRRVSVVQKIRSIVGTLKRIRTKHLKHPVNVAPVDRDLMEA